MSLQRPSKTDCIHAWNKRSLALLTAEPEPCLDDDFGPVNLNGEEPDDLSFLRKPEPCEDVDAILGKLHEIEKDIDFCDGGNPLIFHKRMVAAQRKKAEVIYTYATQVADKRAEELRAENDRLTARIGEMQHMIGLVIQDEKSLGGISKFRLIGLLPPPDEALAATEPKQ